MWLPKSFRGNGKVGKSAPMLHNLNGQSTRQASPYGQVRAQSVRKRKVHSVWGVRIKNPQRGPLFSSIFDNAGKQGPALLSFFLQGCTIAVIMPMRQASTSCCTCSRVLTPGPTTQASLRNCGTVEIECSSQELIPCQRKIATDEIKAREKKLKRAQQYKIALVSALTAHNITYGR